MLPPLPPLPPPPPPPPPPLHPRPFLDQALIAAALNAVALIAVSWLSQLSRVPSTQPLFGLLPLPPPLLMPLLMPPLLQLLRHVCTALFLFPKLVVSHH
jgi:hypothetical protein